MCNTSQNQVEEVLKGTKPTPTTAAIGVLAINIDKNFLSIDKQLSTITRLLSEQQQASEMKFNEMQKKFCDTCTHQKVQCEKRFEEIEDSTEVVEFFSTRPKLLIVVGVGIIFLLGYAMGANIFDLFKTV